MWRFFTSWSFYLHIIVGFLSFTPYPPPQAVVYAAIANCMTVGLMGAFIISEGRSEFDCSELISSNAYYHALPAYLCFFCIPSKPNCPNLTSLALLLALDVTYALTPHNGYIILGKVSNVYGVDYPCCWCAVFALIQISSLSIVQKIKIIS